MSKSRRKKAYTKGIIGGAAERRKLGIHLLIVKVPIAVVRRIDKGIKGQDRQPWLAHVLDKASRSARPLPRPAKRS